MIDFKKGPYLMGVVNVTPDSFSDGGHFLDTEKAIAHASQLLAEGAHILDIGGESTKPGATPVTPEQEQERIIPVIKGIKAQYPNAIISVDTRNADTMQMAINAGTDIINDISALTHDSQSLSVVAGARIPVMLMHMQGTPETMQDKPKYDDVVSEVYDYLKQRIEVCEAAGIDRNMIIIDPGIGFGKTLENNINLLNSLSKFQDLGCALLLGASRKSFIDKIYPNTPADQRLAGSLTAALHGLAQNVQIFRVHDVAETAQAFAIYQALNA